MPIPPFSVPDTTSHDGIRKLFEVFKPIKIGAKGRAFRIKEGADLFDESFLWKADLEETPIAEDLYVLTKLHTVHSFGYHGMFKPSIAEVLKQVPKMFAKLPRVYFEVHGPEDFHDLNLWVEHVHAGVHVALTTLYIPLKGEESGLDVMCRYYADHPETTALMRHGRISPQQSAVRWLEMMDEKERTNALRHFCRCCGKRLTSVLIDSELDPPYENFCDEHMPDPGD